VSFERGVAHPNDLLETGTSRALTQIASLKLKLPNIGRSTPTNRLPPVQLLFETANAMIGCLQSFSAPGELGRVEIVCVNETSNRRCATYSLANNSYHTSLGKPSPRCLVTQKSCVVKWTCV
jgi:hypothetical protein